MKSRSRRRAAVAASLGGLIARALPAGAAATDASRPGGSAALAGPGAGGANSTAPAEPQSTLIPTLRAYVDTLIPADETPAGSALGVDRALLANGVRRDYAQMLELGLAWIDSAAVALHGQRFHLLGESAREAIVGRAAAAEAGSLPRVFFVRTRADAFSHYYGQPESWRGLDALSGPPQPRGYPDFAGATRRKP